jgi:SOS-response transcriptional repressor LexA
MLPYRQLELLRLIFAYIAQEGRPPPSHRNDWLVGKTDCSSNHITNLKRELKNGGYLDIDLSPTNKAMQYFEQLQESGKTPRPFQIISSQIRIQGQVVAGPIYDKLDGIEVNLEALDYPSDKFLTLPDISPHRETFALQVSGQSMEHHHIFDGDYVIVQKFGPTEWPRQNEMIVTKYLPEEWMVEDEEWDSWELAGPTVKVFFEQVEKGRWRLGWKKDNKNNYWMFYTRKLEPIGRVVGIYRVV